MYNPKIKAEFIVQNTTSVSWAGMYERMFERMASYEEAKGKDICTWDIEELQEFIDKISSVRMWTVYKNISMIKTYIRWCEATQIIEGAKDVTDQLHIKGLDVVKKCMLVSPQQLQKYLDIIFSKVEENRVDNAYRGFFWLAFMGVRSPQEALDIKSSDVDFENMIISHMCNEYYIYKEAIPVIRSLIKADFFDVAHPNRVNVDSFRRKREDGNALIRLSSQSTSSDSYTSAVARYTRNKSKLLDGKKITYHNTWLSGVFFRAYERELAGDPVDFSFIAYKEAEGRTSFQVGDKTRRSIILGDINNQYVNNYRRWKCAFGLGASL